MRGGRDLLADMLVKLANGSVGGRTLRDGEVEATSDGEGFLRDGEVQLANGSGGGPLRDGEVEEEVPDLYPALCPAVLCEFAGRVCPF